jgi:predicted dehydrogenase
MSPIRLGLIGAGRIAQSYLEVLESLDDFSLVAVSDVTPGAVDAASSTYQVTGFGDAELMIESAAPEAVLICTPPSTHAHLACHALEAGASVLCEKPLAIDLPAARTMLQTASDRDGLLSMASKFRFVDDVQIARRMVTDGDLGEILLFNNAFTGYVDMAGRWNSDRSRSGGGVIIDNGTHSVDIVRWLFGPITEVLAVEGRRAQPISVEDTAQLFVRAGDDVLGSIDLSWSLDKFAPHYIEIFGTKGTVTLGFQQSRYKLDGGEWTDFGSGYSKGAAFRGQLENFASAIRGESTTLVTAEDAVASVRVIEAAYASLRASSWVPVAGSRPVPVGV